MESKNQVSVSISKINYDLINDKINH